jgi:hypothetical protein
MARKLILIDGTCEYLPSQHERYVNSDIECPTGKFAYLSFAAARQVLKTFKFRRDNYKYNRKCLKVYRCQICREPHIGNGDTKRTRNNI